MEQKIITARDNYIELDQWIKEYNCKKIFMVCDGSICFMERFCRYLEDIEKSGVKIVRFRNFQPNPRYESVVKGVEIFRD